ncbi:unnamed protein product, partial [Chrysoparadoxa australica]
METRVPPRKFYATVGVQGRGNAWMPTVESKGSRLTSASAAGLSINSDPTMRPIGLVLRTNQSSSSPTSEPVRRVPGAPSSNGLGPVELERGTHAGGAALVFVAPGGKGSFRVSLGSLRVGYREIGLAVLGLALWFGMGSGIGLSFLTIALFSASLRVVPLPTEMDK